MYCCGTTTCLPHTVLHIRPGPEASTSRKGNTCKVAPRRPKKAGAQAWHNVFAPKMYVVMIQYVTIFLPPYVKMEWVAGFRGAASSSGAAERPARTHPGAKRAGATLRELWNTSKRGNASRQIWTLSDTLVSVSWWKEPSEETHRSCVTSLRAALTTSFQRFLRGNCAP